MANSCREGAGSSETYTCFKEASALVFSNHNSANSHPNTDGKYKDGQRSSRYFLLLLSTKLLLIIWTMNTKQLISVCKSCVLTQAVWKTHNQLVSSEQTIMATLLILILQGGEKPTHRYF